MTELRETLRQRVERLERYRLNAQQVDKQYTKAGLIEPVIASLGWDVLDPDEVQRGYRPDNSDNSVDYAMLLPDSLRLLILASGLGDDFDDPHGFDQVMACAVEERVEWVMLTDGAEWRVYNALVVGSVQQKLFSAVQIDADIDDAVELLALFTKASMEDNRISEHWPGFFVDRQVQAELVELFSGEHLPQLVALLRRRLPRLNLEQIRLSLLRARATFDFPPAVAPRSEERVRASAESPPAPMGRIDGEASHVQRQPFRIAAPVGPGKPRVSPEERQLRLSDLIGVGRLPPGCTLVARYLGQDHRAELLADGSIRYGRRSFTSPSGAGQAVKADVHGPGVTETTKATDGLEFWHAEDARTGDIVSLKEIRRRTVEDLSRAVPPGDAY
ncbi:restriction system modified-DNA reader domain-containing protein [Micromonospora noduli]|uniref:restriction system modified-DNA reader domain-containing protein n=1 Tax=Micromonospora noduli TaxID=709876 RepID=UPI000DC38A95|nr:restriction endonuclease [Micromonospora noduli]RAO19423.1 hypothetical protein LUPAC07_01809 [Micromonospora noduli]